MCNTRHYTGDVGTDANQHLLIVRPVVSVHFTDVVAV